MSTVTSLLSQSKAVFHLDDGPASAAELADEGARLAAALGARGLGPGDRMAMWCSNGRAYLRCLAAAAAGRFVVVSVNTRFSADEAWSITHRAGASALVSDHEVEPRGEVEVIRASEIESLLDRPPLPTQPRPDDPFVVFTTSGTTSRPKLVLHTQQSIADHAADIPGPFRFGPDTRMLISLPLCGVFGFCNLTGALAAGAEVWMPSAFDADAASALIERERIDAMSGPDDMMHRMLATGHDLTSLDLVGYGRFNSSLHDIVERAEAAGVGLTGLYGMSEVQALFLLQDSRAAIEVRSPGGGAVVSPRGAARVVDPETDAVLPVGIEGELQLRGPSLFDGYLAEGGSAIDAELTETAHVVDGEGQRWFKTGDLARGENDGTYTFLTRMGDVLRLGGFLVSPAEIEDVLIEVDGITEAQVVTVARPGGVRPVALVIAAGALDEAAIRRHCASKLARFKVPIRIIAVDEFPVTPSANGTKIQRNKLQQMAEEAIPD